MVSVVGEVACEDVGSGCWRGRVERGAGKRVGAAVGVAVDEQADRMNNSISETKSVFFMEFSVTRKQSGSGMSIWGGALGVERAYG